MSSGQQPDPRLSVFINCPFDAAYQPLFRAIFLACVACGYVPRSALESGSVATPRLDRIIDALFSSAYSIHDLTRCQGEPRFNMPLELGMAMARRYASPGDHDWMVLVPEGHAYQQFVSDLSGIDPRTHDGSGATVVKRVMAWLATIDDAVITPSPLDVIALLPQFDAVWIQSTHAWGQIQWRLLVQEAIRIAKTLS